MATLSKDPNALHEHLAATLEGALGRPLPQLQVQFRHLSVTAQVVVSDANAQTTELPTLVNTIKRAAAGIVAKRHVVEKHILRDVTGRFKPGTMTLILGQPGSGKSTLMKILSGRLHKTKSVQVEGDISYNGRPIDDIRTKIPQLVSYVEQHDTHFPTLSVNETLQFAHEFTGSEYYRRGQELLAHGTADENVTAVKTVEELEKAYPDLVVQHLGLQNCQNTWIGDAMTRGVSGGERKRVTTGEMAFGLKYVSLMDEISTGLDSAATFDIVYSQREIARKMRRAVVISLLQPSPEVFDLFDDVMILNAGHVMYYGPRSEAESYFAELGFPCPTGRDVADFLLDLGTKEQLKYEFQQDDRRTVNFGGLPRFPSEFAESYRQSRVFQALVDDMDSEKESQSIDAVNEHIDRMPEFHQSLWENTLTLIRRETMLSIRNTAFIRGRATMVIVMGLIYGSLYYQTDFTNIQVVLGVLFSSVMFLMLGQTAQISTFVDARAVFYKQRSSNFTRTAAYTIASCVRQLPLAITEAVVFGAFIYWMVGLESSVERFLIFEALFALTILVYVGWFFFIASIAPDRHILFPIAMISIVFFILFTGFVMPKGQIPDYMIWIYWIDPLAWVIRALAVNEYRWGDLSTCVFDGVDYCAQFGMTSGEYYLSLFGVPSGKQWVAYAVIYLVVAYVLCMGLAWFALEYIRYDTPESAAAAAEAGMEEAKSQEGYSSAETPRSNDRSSTVIPISSQSAACVPVTLAFRDLHYTVPAPDHPNESIELLKGISGYALPGTITALMGSTGAGKTTLMDVIAGRKTGGTIDGKILLNGYEATPLAIQRSTGYCEQMDIHSEAATFREALTFSAFLRQDSSVPASTKFEAVEECLELLDLMPIADKIIRGSSTEQMKRLTIGVELAAQPSVLFLDEPTSGLDARSAKLIMDGVRKVADTGRTIVCTIHQPSAEVFKVFDNLLLLKLGGETVYFGKLGRKCHALIEYFEAIPGVTKIREGYNPATWMLECIGAGVAHSHGASDKEADFVDRFQRSDLMVRLDAMLDKDGIGRPAPDTPELLFAKKRAASSVVQMQFLVRRFVDMYWRTPSYNLTRFGIYLVLAVLFGIMFLPTEYETYQGINAGLGIVSMTVIFTGFMSFNSVLPIAIDDRAAFYRERASQTYSALWYFVGSTLVEIPYVFLCGLLFTAIFFPMVGFTGWSTWALYWLNTSLLMLQQTYLGQLLAYTMPTLEVAALLGAALNSTLMMFIGFNPPATSIPRGYKWLYTITPQHYSMSILGALVFADCDDEPIFNATLGEYVGGGSALGCQPLSGVPLTIGHSTVKEFVEGNFKIKHDEIWMNFGITIAFTIAFRLLALVALRFVNHQKK